MRLINCRGDGATIPAGFETDRTVVTFDLERRNDEARWRRASKVLDSTDQFGCGGKI
jgi:hypothetical protein